MNSAHARLAMALAALSLAGCHAAASPATLRMGPALAPAPTSLRVNLDAAPVRKLLGLERTAKVRVTVEGPGTQAPYSVDLDVKNVLGEPNVLIPNAPTGERRLVTLRFLDAANKPIDGLYYRAFKGINVGSSDLIVNDLTTAYGDVFSDMLTRYAEAAAAIDLGNITYVVDETIRALHVASPRLLDAKAIATVLKDTTGKNLPTPDPNWAGKPGYVSVGFLDSIPGVRIKVTVDDLSSAPVYSQHGEPVMVGPITPRAEAYQMRVTAVLDEPGADLILPPYTATVSQDKPLLKMPSIFFSKSKPGDPLPARIGGGPGVVIGDKLWMVGGLIQPAGLPAGLTGEPRVHVAETIHTFTRAGKWVTANAIPDEGTVGTNFPRYGQAVAVDGNQIYLFGGHRGDGFGTDAAFVLDTSGSNAVSRLPAKMKLSAARLIFSSTAFLTEASAAKVGGKIYVAAGTLTYPDQPIPVAPRGFIDMLEFDPVTGQFADEPPLGLDETQVCASMAGAVVADKWYLFGGYRGPSPSGEGYMFNGTAWTPLTEKMPTPRSHAGTVVVDGKIWFIGGEEMASKPSRAVEVFDPASGTWTVRAPLKTARSLPTVGVVKTADNKTSIVIAGGLYGAHADELGLPLPADKTEEITP